MVPNDYKHNERRREREREAGRERGRVCPFRSLLYGSLMERGGQERLCVLSDVCCVVPYD